MTISRLILSVLFSISQLLLSAQATDVQPDGYKLVWSDEFNGNSLDEKAWNIEVNGDGGGNQELQFYRRENVAVADGNLVITARRENYSNRSFTSGRVNSRNKAYFKHGILQARIKMPKTADGLWPAYWMMGNDYGKVGWPRCGEMDIVEMGHSDGIRNSTQDRYFSGTLHFGKSAGNVDHHQISQDFTAPADNAVTNDDYHIFTVEWDDNNLYMYYDLKGYSAAQKRSARYFSTSITSSDADSAPGKYFQKQFFFIFNLAVGGNFTGIYNPNNITALLGNGAEAKMLIDWVRVYQAESDENALYTTPEGTNVPETPEEPVVPTGPDLTEYGYYGGAALNKEGVSTFDFANSTDAVLIGTSGGVTDALSTVTAADYNVDDTSSFLWVWSDTYSSMPSTGVNSFGFEEAYNHYQVNNVGWSGLGYASQGKGKNLSMIDDEHILHFGMRGIDNDRHANHQIIVGNAKFTLGQTAFEGAVVLGDFKRDGSWTYFDIPVKILKKLAGGELFTDASNYMGNVFAILSGGVSGTDLQFDNVFFYKNPNVNKTEPTVDNKTEIGRYAGKSLVDGKYTFELDNVNNAVLIGTSAGVTEALTDATLKNYNVDDINNFFWIWEGGDYTGLPSEVANSFGWDEPSTRLKVTGASTWCGAGYASQNKGKDLSMIDDTYYLHFAMRGADVLTHASQTVTVGNAKFVIGNSTNGDQILGDYKRDGEWYNFDIPVSKLQQLAGGTLFTDASNFLGNVFAVTTSHFAGAEVNFDNVFFYQKKSGNEPVEIPIYASRALDDEGNSLFEFEKAQSVVLIGTSGGVTDTFLDQTIANYNVDDVNNFLYVWSDTYTAQSFDGKNSFGYDEGITVYTVGGAGWSGLGYASQGKGKDLSMLDDSYTLHFAMASTAKTVYLVIVGGAKFAIGAEGFNDNGIITPSITDFPRDGQWYNIDIPYSEIRSRTTTVFDNPKNFLGNVFAVLSGGVQGTKLQFDNVFFYSSIPTGIEKNIAAGSESLGIYDVSGRKVTSMNGGGVYILRTVDGAKKVLVK